MNDTEPSSASLSEDCIDVYRDDEHVVEKQFFTVTSIILNIISCPPTILLNALVIVAVKTRRRLQTMYHILLAFLALADLLVGISIQPYFIAREIGLITKSWTKTICMSKQWIEGVVRIICFTSLFHLSLLSVERFLLVKSPFRYSTLVTLPRVTLAVVIGWAIATARAISIAISHKHLLEKIFKAVNMSFIFASLFTIAFCHVSIYVECRRQARRIKCEQVSREDTKKFLREKKAWKTTGILIGVVCVCYLPGMLVLILRKDSPVITYFDALLQLCQPLVISIILLNSLCNPLIYWWKNKKIRKAFLNLLTLGTSCF